MGNIEDLKQSIGHDNPSLAQVLKWHSSNKRDKYSHFEVSNGEAYFCIYDGDEKDSIVWDLGYDELQLQSKELIDWLCDLI